MIIYFLAAAAAYPLSPVMFIKPAQIQKEKEIPEEV